ncbi:zona pellucida-like domain-containing protein 1 [Hoplias malabaricus]|uniref:zona pellucida-like domain-containing protein 1 n=1 Tax=Hoplias malabaricus TaxID=27720 RepID=UPI003462D024
MNDNLFQGLRSINVWKTLLQIFLISITVAAVSSQLTGANCYSYLRRPEYSDIDVECGTNSIGLAIQICPAIYTGYNESLLFLNNIKDDPNCKGTLDITVTPPVLRFSFPINRTTACGSIFKTISTPGSGIFSDFSNVQTVNISGLVRSYDPTISPVTYNAELKYFYSCAYPLEYFINNTEMDVSSVSIAMKSNNGSFISTLTLDLYSDQNFTQPLVIPSVGIEVKTDIFVQVKATNLTSQYYVLLDRCYACTSLEPYNATYYNLFLPCFSEAMTILIENGVSNQARFSFPAFRFIEQLNQTVSKYYLHCVTRLCEKSLCGTFRLCFNGRKRREMKSASSYQSGVSESATVTSRAIITRTSSSAPIQPSNLEDRSVSESDLGSTVALGVFKPGFKSEKGCCQQPLCSVRVLNTAVSSTDTYL